MSFVHVNTTNKLIGNKPRGGKRVMKIHPTASANMSQQMQPIVVLLQPLNNTFTMKKFILADKEKVKIGRQTTTKTMPSDTNGYFDSKVLSRSHAEVWNDRGKVYIKDVKSSNGTFVNNRRLSPEGSESEPEELHDGDILEFGIDILGDDNHTIMYKKVSAKVLTSGAVTIDPNNISSGDERGAVVQKNGSLITMINSSLEREIINTQETNRLLKNVKNKIDAFGDRLAEKNVEVKTEEAAEQKRKQSLTSLLSSNQRKFSRKSKENSKSHVKSRTRSNSIISNEKPPIPPEDNETVKILNGELNPTHKSLLHKIAASRSSSNSIDLGSKIPSPNVQHDDNTVKIVNGNENSENKFLLSRPRSNSFGSTRIPVFSQAGDKDSVLANGHGDSAVNVKNRPRSKSIVANENLSLKKHKDENNNTSIGIIPMKSLVDLENDSLKLTENGINDSKVSSDSDEEPLIVSSLPQDDEKMTFVVHKNSGHTDSPDKLETKIVTIDSEDQTKDDAGIHVELHNLTKQESLGELEMDIPKSDSMDINEQAIASKSLDDFSNTNSSSIILKGKGRVEEVESNLSENPFDNSHTSSVMTLIRNPVFTPNFDNDDSVVISKMINSIITPDLQNSVDKGTIVINSKEITVGIRGSSPQPIVSKIPRRKSIDHFKESCIIDDHVISNDSEDAKSSSVIRRHSIDLPRSTQSKNTIVVHRCNSLNSQSNTHSSNSSGSSDLNFVNFKKETRQRLAEIKRVVDSDDNNKKIASLSRELKASTLRVNDLSTKLTEMDKRCQSYARREKELRESLDELKKSLTEIQESRTHDYSDAEALSRRLAVREAHLARIKESREKGTLILGGALLKDAKTDVDNGVGVGDGSESVKANEEPKEIMNGSLMILEAETVQDVHKFVEQDPYVTGSVWERVVVLPFKMAPK
ncbi:6893_t:CDS:10 [Ambispora gerdemannii]|uniref:6893_t:CDS:1 n=1 Tax=Ambispora gerdemannii TaxID=144530 RepID=A0A9N8V3P0_9GLOM|nr:6893_t:CDS:10 [Ambispora gerdemannii]